ncbi:hypothetical protein [Streptomyces sp. XD-27]|uniref:hypothetical protein n=1 Tax=Streptomyces sp. XD-27 TaxID=3062779 RepID=UPI0026F4376E|nr:hypothetical protein [Streptomyces sp. XD-27]WKX69356.1 hypothetical protein Q3Y56_04955 [Streptomyces sp. XD-27]
MVRKARPVAVLLASWALACCGVPDTRPESSGAPAGGGRTVGAARWVRVYFVAPNGAWPVARAASAGAGPQAALDELLAGPTRNERNRGLVTALPAGRHKVRATAAGPGAVDLYLPWLVVELDGVAVNQLVCTGAAAPGIPGGRRPADVVVRVYESGEPGEPWRVRCDETGTAIPVEAPPTTG